MRTSFTAMGTTVTIRIVVRSRRAAAGAALLRRAEDRVNELETRWSRFIPSSEISALNRARGVPTAVSTDTRLLVSRAIRAWNLTEGRFDPAVHDSVVALGYDVSFEHLAGRRAMTPSIVPSPGCAHIVVDDRDGTVTLPADGGFDPGGIGKGLAADLVARELCAAGADGACVEIGGDVRVTGSGPEDRGWVVQIEHPLPGRAPAANVWLEDGGVASSSSVKRRWHSGDGPRHHLVEPASGHPAQGALGATAIARSAWIAEALATATCVDPASDDISASGACGFVFSDGGRVRTVGDVARFVA